MTHGYFTDKARDAFTRAGGDPDRSTALATWAEQAHAAGDSHRGVLVDDQGEILADTVHSPATASTPGATYVTDVHLSAARFEIQGREVGLAAGSLRRLTGRGVIHVTYSEVCAGRSVR